MARTIYTDRDYLGQVAISSGLVLLADPRTAAESADQFTYAADNGTLILRQVGNAVVGETGLDNGVYDVYVERYDRNDKSVDRDWRGRVVSLHMILTSD